jgi:hypothetical protein
MAKQHILRKGQTYVFTSGQYDSYQIEGFTEMLKDLDLRGLNLSHESLYNFIIKNKYGRQIAIKEVNSGMGFKDFINKMRKGELPKPEWLYNIH